MTCQQRTRAKMESGPKLRPTSRTHDSALVPQPGWCLPQSVASGVESSSQGHSIASDRRAAACLEPLAKQPGLPASNTSRHRASSGRQRIPRSPKGSGWRIGRVPSACKWCPDRCRCRVPSAELECTPVIVVRLFVGSLYCRIVLIRIKAALAGRGRRLMGAGLRPPQAPLADAPGAGG
jgi:hypothetical protein